MIRQVQRSSCAAASSEEVDVVAGAGSVVLRVRMQLLLVLLLLLMSHLSSGCVTVSGGAADCIGAVWRSIQIVGRGKTLSCYCRAGVSDNFCFSIRQFLSMGCLHAVSWCDLCGEPDGATESTWNTGTVTTVT